MNIFLCNEVVRELPFVEQCKLARECGYDGLELAPFTLGPEPHLLHSEHIREIRTIADGEGVAIGGLHWLLATPPGLSITSAEPAVQRFTLQFGRSLVGLCRELGGSYLVHGSPAQRQFEPGREAEGRSNGCRYFAAMAEAASDAGLSYYIEPLSRNDTAFVTSVEEAIEIIDGIGSGALATMVDCYAAASNGEDIVSLLRRWIPSGRIRHVHFNDPNKRGPGEGGLGFAPVVDVLCELNYAGSAAVEPFVYKPDGPACAARAIGYLRGLLEAHRSGMDATQRGNHGYSR